MGRLLHENKDKYILEVYMSAIFGAVELKNQVLPLNYGKQMEKSYKTCILDRIQSMQEESVLFGCGTKYITQEDHMEMAPFYDENLGLYFTVDVYLDNREELLQRLGGYQEGHSDAFLMFELYKRYGTSMLDFVLGSFSFAAYHKNDNYVLLACDVVGSRCLYYSMREQQIRYSTLIGAILDTDREKREINERWMIDFLAQDSLAMTTECMETPYQGIEKVQPGEYIKFSLSKIERVFYWNPVEQIKIDKNKKDEDIKEEFQYTLKQAVQSGLRSEKETGILLSGGLDSTSVACFAAPLCKENHAVLQTYTSIPRSDYVTQRNAYFITNEREQVEETCAYIGNMNPHFLSLEKDNPWDMSDEILKVLEIPYKALQNCCFDLRVLQEASQNGCNVMLIGQYGNVTISYGDFEIYFLSLLRHGHILRLNKQIKQLKIKRGASRKKVYKQVFRVALPKRKRKDDCHLFDEVYVKPEYLMKYSVQQRFHELGLDGARPTTQKVARKYIYARTALSQVGEIETKFSLATGVLMKDPTRDKRVISLCLTLPYEQLVKDGVDRRLVREYLKDRIPPHIQRETILHKGLQSADVMHRIKSQWSRIHREIESILKEKSIPYIDYERMSESMKQIEKDFGEEDEYLFRKIVITCLASKFLQK